jgi:hypothetical protein
VRNAAGEAVSLLYHCCGLKKVLERVEEEEEEEDEFDEDGEEAGGEEDSTEVSRVVGVGGGLWYHLASCWLCTRGEVRLWWWGGRGRHGWLCRAQKENPEGIGARDIVACPVAGCDVTVVKSWGWPAEKYVVQISPKRLASEFAAVHVT